MCDASLRTFTANKKLYLWRDLLPSSLLFPYLGMLPSVRFFADRPFCHQNKSLNEIRQETVGRVLEWKSWTYDFILAVFYQKLVSPRQNYFWQVCLGSSLAKMVLHAMELFGSSFVGRELNKRVRREENRLQDRYDEMWNSEEPTTGPMESKTGWSRGFDERNWNILFFFHDSTFHLLNKSYPNHATFVAKVLSS